MPDRSNGVTIVVPAYNEAEAIEHTLVVLRETLRRVDRPAEVVVVDDGSTDDTAVVARQAGARVIRHPTNGGYGRALLTGIESAAHDIIAIVDADGTYPVAQLPELLAAYDQGFDMVVGARQGRHYTGSFGQQLLRAIFRLLAEFTCGRSIPDINSGFRVFRRGPVLAARASLSPGFSFTTTITLLFMLRNLFVAYLPIPYHSRVGKSKVRLIPDSLRSLQIIVTAIAQYNPLKLILLLLVANSAGTVILALLANVFSELGQSSWLIVSLGWDTSFLTMALAVLTLTWTKPKSGD